MAATFLQSFIDYCHAQPLLKANFRMGRGSNGVDGNPWVDQVPAGQLTAILPLIVIEDYNETYADTHERVYLTTATFGMTVYAEGLATAEARATDVSSSLELLIEDPRAFPMDKPNTLSGFYWNGRQIGREEVRRADGDWVYRVRLNFEARYRTTYLGAP